METKKLTNWFNWYKLVNLFLIIKSSLSNRFARQEWKVVVDDAYNEESNIELYRRALSNILAWEARDQSVPPTLICLKELLLAKLYQIDKSNASIEQMYWYQSILSMNIIRFGLIEQRMVVDGF